MRRLLPVLLAVSLLVVAACSDDGGSTDGDAGTTDSTTATAAPADFSGRGPYAVGEIDLELDADHKIAVFYPIDDVPDDAEPYSYSGDTIFGPSISNLLPGALSGDITIPDTYVGPPASADGPFPVVLHSHGFSGNLRFGNRHNAAVASWGYVVAAVDHPERGVVSILESFVSGSDGGARPDEYLDSDQLIAGLDLLGETNDDRASPLAGAVDTEHVAAEGHSAGGSASGTAAYDDRVDLWMGQAPGAPLEPGTDLTPFTQDDGGGTGLDYGALLEATDPPPVPSLIIAAEGDTVVTLDRVEQTYDWLDTPKRLAVIADSGHAVFVDPCLPIREEGGLSGFVESLGLDPADVPLVELGENGCLPGDTDPEAIWPLIDHLTVAQLDEVFGDDPAVGTASLDRDYLDETFPGLLADLHQG